ncbi:hypothetical protein RZS08_08045, partial [Arthrospira platensis SPKY1]|nr:hypothetical protein [Arthrospira platensis SPKY1]
ISTRARIVDVDNDGNATYHRKKSVKLLGSDNRPNPKPASDPHKLTHYEGFEDLDYDIDRHSSSENSNE